MKISRYLNDVSNKCINAKDPAFKYMFPCRVFIVYMYLIEYAGTRITCFSLFFKFIIPDHHQNHLTSSNMQK